MNFLYEEPLLERVVEFGAYLFHANGALHAACRDDGAKATAYTWRECGSRGRCCCRRSVGSGGLRLS